MLVFLAPARQLLNYLPQPEGSWDLKTDLKCSLLEADKKDEQDSTIEILAMKLPHKVTKHSESPQFPLEELYLRKQKNRGTMVADRLFHASQVTGRWYVRRPYTDCWRANTRSLKRGSEMESVKEDLFNRRANANRWPYALKEQCDWEKNKRHQWPRTVCVSACVRASVTNGNVKWVLFRLTVARCQALIVIRLAGQ